MSVTEWFEGRSAEEEHHERAYWSRILTEIACAVIAGLLLAGLPGCATQEEGPRHEVCQFQLLGQTSDGMPVVDALCVTPEKFAEMQK